LKIYNSSKKVYNDNMLKKGFSLLEILITVTLLIILVVLLILVFNPQTQIKKAKDSKRKSELTTLSKVLEDWYNDKGCYPTPDEICYDSAGSETCHICGTEPTSPNLVPYLNEIPCDPQQPVKKYTYDVDEPACPKNYWIYTDLANDSDPSIEALGCQNGCGPYGDCNYNYGVTSPGGEVENCTGGVGGGGGGGVGSTPTPTPFYSGGCSTFNPIYYFPDPGICNVCGTYQECLGAFPTMPFYSDPGCTQTCIKD
jgi:type II secretory pathway pseudopilin PulG